MRRTGQTGRGTVAARLLPLLAVVLGLLAMHGLASTHHAAAAPAWTGTPSAVAAVDSRPAVRQDGHGPREHDLVASGASAATVGPLFDRAVTGPAVPECDDDCTDGLAILCAAVLAATAAAACLLAAAARRPVPTPARRGPQARAPVRARRLPPRVDPVAELCVSRT